MLVVLLTAAAPAAAAEPEPDGAPAKVLFDAGRFEEAAASYGELAAEYAARYPQSDAQRYYCGEGGAEALLYLTTAATDGVSASVIGTDWCEALFMQAYSFVEMKRLDLAIEPLEQAHELAPYNAKYANELGFVLSRLGRLDEGMAAYRRAIAGAELAEGQDRNKAVAWRGVGWIHSDRREWDLAEEALRKSLEIDPDNPMALGELDYIAQQRSGK